MSRTSSGLELQVRSGEAARAQADALAQLRIQVFREFPYLYEGSLEYEREYLESYFQCENSVIAVARTADGRVVGATTGLPLAASGAEAAEVQRPFLEQGWSLSEVFYLGESVLLPELRGQGLYREFFAVRESHARRLGQVVATFAAVERPPHHPRRPRGYAPLDAVWAHFGYVKSERLVTHFRWRDVGDSEETEKPMRFWLKRLRPG